MVVVFFFLLLFQAGPNVRKKCFFSQSLIFLSFLKLFIFFKSVSAGSNNRVWYNQQALLCLRTCRGMSGLARPVGRWVSASPPHTGHQLAFTGGREDSIEMIKLINRSDFFFLPVFLLKMFFFFFSFFVFFKFPFSPRFSKNG